MLKYDNINELFEGITLESSNESFKETDSFSRFEETLTLEDKEDLINWSNMMFKNKWFLQMFQFLMNEIVNRTIKGRGDIDSAYFMMAGLSLFKKEFERLSLNFEDKNNPK